MVPQIDINLTLKRLWTCVCPLMCPFRGQQPEAPSDHFKFQSTTGLGISQDTSFCPQEFLLHSLSTLPGSLNSSDTLFFTSTFTKNKKKKTKGKKIKLKIGLSLSFFLPLKVCFFSPVPQEPVVFFLCFFFWLFFLFFYIQCQHQPANWLRQHQVTRQLAGAL